MANRSNPGKPTVPTRSLSFPDDPQAAPSPTPRPSEAGVPAPSPSAAPKPVQFVRLPPDQLREITDRLDEHLDATSAIRAWVTFMGSSLLVSIIASFVFAAVDSESALLIIVIGLIASAILSIRDRLLARGRRIHATRR